MSVKGLSSKYPVVPRIVLFQEPITSAIIVTSLFSLVLSGRNILVYAPDTRAGCQAIKETWASHCDGFVAFSDSVDLELNT